MSKFPYGYDIEKYIEEGLNTLKETYPWATKEMLDKYTSYSIEKINNKYEYIIEYKYYNDEIEKKILDVDKEGFIEKFIKDNSSSIEYANEVKDVFKIETEEEINLTGWYLERYEFRTHKLGGYSVFIQAGDRTAGGSRTMFFDKTYFKGTYDDFLNKYFDEMHAGIFGLSFSFLKNYKGLKEFLGFKK